MRLAEGFCCDAARRSGHSLRLRGFGTGELIQCGTLLPLSLQVFADAAFACRRGTLIAASQPMLQDRLFKAILRCGLQTVLSPQHGPAKDGPDSTAAPAPRTNVGSSQSKRPIVAPNSSKQTFTFPTKLEASIRRLSLTGTFSDGGVNRTLRGRRCAMHSTLCSVGRSVHRTLHSRTRCCSEGTGAPAVRLCGPEPRILHFDRYWS
ncbi:hypothetical protein PhaeoP72_02384 [Phaeobacter inhibens]|nr:hypothetical protein PhaeoP72_02384 [Phaeobacter inhibens]